MEGFVLHPCSLRSKFILIRKIRKSKMHGIDIGLYYSLFSKFLYFSYRK